MPQLTPCNPLKSNRDESQIQAKDGGYVGSMFVPLKHVEQDAGAMPEWWLPTYMEASGLRWAGLFLRPALEE